MGCGSSKKVEGVRMKTFDSLSYPRHLSLNIKERNNALEVVKIFKYEMDLPHPTFLLTKEVTLSNTNVFISACVLPGVNPRKTKHCQDRFVVEFDGTRLLAGAFDGHGAQGHDCAQFLTEGASRYFLSASEAEKADPKAFILKMTDKINDDLIRSSAESQSSGSTVSLFVIDDLKITSGSVGDSRACLGTTKVQTKDPNEFEVTGQLETEAHLKAIRQARKFPPSGFHAIQLTKDCKPNDPDEMFRIFRSGGKVDRSKKPNGQPYGAYRVFGKAKDVPGLAMSRSLGDTASRDSGVISTPIMLQFGLDLETDYFCVTGSDGIWDVMENQEVVDFIEAFRRYSKKDQTPSQSPEVVPSSCTIAQLLCEEARLRWISVVEEEDEPIDDISAVVVELRPPVTAHSTPPQSP
jgi:serine/threonine protein phosphatase PrpC